MNAFKFHILLFLLLAGHLAQAQNFSNKGKEFWVGYGHNYLFTYTGSLNGQDMILYLSAEQAANVTVSINGTSYTKTYAIPANTVMPSDLIPKSGVNDARILTEGLNTHAIHIVSDVPITAFAHTYGINSSGGTMLLPVESYGYTFFSLNGEQNQTDGNAYSWFYAVASENNTRVRITPVRATVGGRAQAVPFEITLNKGEMYNVMGVKQSSGNSFDMSGSKIESIPGSDGSCHPISVFSGSSRTSICLNVIAFGQSGSDFSMDEVPPTNAWGSTYVVGLTSSSDGPGILNNNRIRIYLRDKSTVVKVNGVVLTGLTNNFLYDYLATTSDVITANKPVMVAQFITSGFGCGATGDGDPEMLYLSPVDQAIKSCYWYNTNLQNITVNYLTLVIPTGGMQTLMIDGSQKFDSTYAHPHAPGYTVVIKKLPSTPMQHHAQSDTAFTAVTYGLGVVESYGYNTGTYIKNLEVIAQVKNLYGPASSTGCFGTPAALRLKTTYSPSSIFWQLSAVPSLAPNVDVTQNAPVPVDSVTETGRKYYIYQLPGNYSFKSVGIDSIPITLSNIASDNCSTTTTFKLPIEVIAGPTADFTSVASACAKDSVVFTGSSKDAIMTNKWLWSFGDGGIDSIQKAKKAYPVSGTYHVKLQVVRTPDGCLFDTTKAITINVLPTVDFKLKDSIICMPSGLVTFINTSTVAGDPTAVINYQWSFGDKDSSKLASPTHTYPAVANYTAKLFATISSTGCTDTVSHIISGFVQRPTVDFTNAAIACLKDTVLFTGISNSAIAPNKWLWTFGDGNVDSIQQTKKAYALAGTYSVKLHVVRASDGCTADTTKTITIDATPLVDFTLSTNTFSGCSNDSIVFTGTSKDVIATNKWLWAFGDGSVDSVNQAKKKYALAGSYTVKLSVVRASDGCVGDTSKSVTINVPPMVDFKLKDSIICMPNGLVTFINTSSLPSNPTAVINYQWNFGDNTTSTSASPVHTYTSAANYTVKLLATLTATGCSDTVSHIINGFVQKPTVDFTSMAIACLKDTVLFTGISNGAIATNKWLWNFGDGNIDSIQQTKKAYALAGTYTVKVQVIRASDGCTSDTTKTITINALPTVDFNWVNAAASICAKDSILFTGSSNSAIATNMWLWNFGDGSIDSVQQVKKSYAVPGSYNVKLHVVRASDGCAGDVAKTVTINALPIADFKLKDSIICMPGGNVFFINNSSVPGGTAASINYQWNFGDNATSTAAAPNHYYSTAGVYTVKLVATVATTGCLDTTSHVVNGFVLNPKADFGPSALQACVNTFIAFTDSSTPAANITLRNWYANNTLFSSSQNPSKQFATAGNYDIRLIVTDANKCSDTATKTYQVLPLPTVNAGPDQQINSGTSIQLLATTSSALSSILWSPASTLSSATVLQPFASPTADQQYEITVTDQYGCTATDDVLVKVILKLFVANAFTPNNDGHNDKWVIPALDYYPNSTVEVFNRYGQVIFRSNGLYTPWDGTINGNPVPVGAYYYIIDTHDAIGGKAQGSLMVLR